MVVRVPVQEQKKKPLADKIVEGNPGGRKLTLTEFKDTADLKGLEMPEPNKMLKATQKGRFSFSVVPYILLSAERFLAVIKKLFVDFSNGQPVFDAYNQDAVAFRFRIKPGKAPDF